MLSSWFSNKINYVLQKCNQTAQGSNERHTEQLQYLNSLTWHIQVHSRMQNIQQTQPLQYRVQIFIQHNIIIVSSTDVIQKCWFFYRLQPAGLRAPKQLLDILLQIYRASVILNVQGFRIQRVQGNVNHSAVSYLNAQRGGGWRIAVHDATLLVNQELGEVPLDAVTEKATFARLQELVQGGYVLAIDINLADNRM